MSEFRFTNSIKTEFSGTRVEIQAHPATMSEPRILIDVGAMFTQRISLTQEDARLLAAILTYFSEIGQLPESFEACQP
jgi:hypothetical protein